MEQGGLQIRYRLQGDLGLVRFPAPLPPAPADNLWQQTCCEAFITGPGDAYREFNFSPSGQWAVYHFDAYRQRDPGFVAPAAPRIAVTHRAGHFELSAHLPAALVPGGLVLRLGLAMVIELTAGSVHYWALTHAAGPPDFHRRTSFLIDLPCP